MSATKIKTIMTRNPSIIAPDATITEAAKRMHAVDCGCLPVGTGEHVAGMITDRDIALRVVAEGRDPARTHVSEVMTKGAYTIDENADVEDAATEMHNHDIARLVVTSNKKVTGIVTMAEILRDVAAANRSPKVLRELAKPRTREPQPAH